MTDFVQAGWWNHYVLSGKVHDHPTDGDRRKRVNPTMHRGCEPVYVARGSCHDPDQTASEGADFGRTVTDDVC